MNLHLSADLPVRRVYGTRDGYRMLGVSVAFVCASVLILVCFLVLAAHEQHVSRKKRVEFVYRFIA